jgi:hypothetical protein
MKKWLCLALVLSLLLLGCGKEETIENPVIFYYRTAEITYFGANGVIDYEKREAGVRADDYIRLLNEYLLGPNTEGLDRTFPNGTAVQELTINEGRVKIVLSKAFAELTGVDLSIACACLTLTTCLLTGTKSAEISADSALLDGSPVITMVYSQLVLEDLCREPVEPN